MLWQLENQAEWCQFCPSFLYSLWNRLWKSEGVGLSSQETVSHSNKCVCCKVAQRGRNRELHHISHICALSNKCCVLVCLCVCVCVCDCACVCVVVCVCLCGSECWCVCFVIFFFSSWLWFKLLAQLPHLFLLKASSAVLISFPPVLFPPFFPYSFPFLPALHCLLDFFFYTFFIIFLLFLLSTFLLLLFCLPPHLLFISLSSSSFVWFCDHFFSPSLISLYLSSPLHSFIFSFLPSPLLLPLYISYCCWLGLKWSIALWEVGGGGLW